MLAVALLLPLARVPLAAAGACPDEDGDGICDVDDECNGSVPLTGTRLRLRKIQEPAGQQHVKMKGSMTVATVPTIDPLAKGLRMVIRDATGVVSTDVTIPPGEMTPENRRGWRRVGMGDAFVYSDREGSVEGIKQVSFRHHGGGAIKFAIFGKDGPYLPPAVLPVTVTIVVDSPVAAGGQCAEVTYGDHPGCFYLNSGNKLICR